MGDLRKDIFSEIAIIDEEKKALRDVYREFQGAELRIGEEEHFIRQIEGQIKDVYRRLDQAERVIKNAAELIEKRKAPGVHHGSFDLNTRGLESLIAQAYQQYLQLKKISDMLEQHEGTSKNLRGALTKQLEQMRRLLKAHSDSLAKIKEDLKALK